MPTTKPLLLLPLLLFAAGFLYGTEMAVGNMATFDAAMKTAVPGDTIVLNSGEWKDADLRVRASGEAGKPITVRAAEPGGVKLTGRSRLRIAGEHVVVEGLWFRNCFTEKSDIVAFREDPKNLGSHCVLRGCAITQDIPAMDDTDRKWVSLYGSGNVVEHCHFEGKTSKGTLLVVWLPQPAGEAPRHRIQKNYFGPRPRLGVNGGEIIRVGDSESSLQSAACVIAENIFEKCDGEVECISNKSCDNEYRGNLFIECQGTLTLRHGNRCHVTGNVFNGNDRKETGGIRVIGEDHVVDGNYLSGITGDDTRSAICLMDGMEHSPLSGYFQVKGAVIKNNAILDCDHSITIGYSHKDVKAPLAPVDCRFEGNYVSAEGRKLINVMDPGAKITWRGNIMWGSETGVGMVSGIRLNEVRMKRGVPPVPSREDVGAPWLRGAAAN